MPEDKTMRRPWTVEHLDPVHFNSTDPSDPLVNISSPDGLVAEKVFLSDAMLILGCVNTHEEVLAALKQVEPMAKTLMDEHATGKGPATDWGVVNTCLCDVRGVLWKLEEQNVPTS